MVFRGSFSVEFNDFESSKDYHWMTRYSDSKFDYSTKEFTLMRQFVYDLCAGSGERVVTQNCLLCGERCGYRWSVSMYANTVEEQADMVSLLEGYCFRVVHNFNLPPTSIQCDVPWVDVGGGL